MVVSEEGAKDLMEDMRFALDARTDVFVQHARQVQLVGGRFMNVMTISDFTLALASYIEKLGERGILLRKDYE